MLLPLDQSVRKCSCFSSFFLTHTNVRIIQVKSIKRQKYDGLDYAAFTLCYTLDFPRTAESTLLSMKQSDLLFPRAVTESVFSLGA